MGNGGLGDERPGLTKRLTGIARVTTDSSRPVPTRIAAGVATVVAPVAVVGGTAVGAYAGLAAIDPGLASIVAQHAALAGDVAAGFSSPIALGVILGALTAVDASHREQAMRQRVSSRIRRVAIGGGIVTGGLLAAMAGVDGLDLLGTHAAAFATGLGDAATVTGTLSVAAAGITKVWTIGNPPRQRELTE